jgi:hypothetical protein
MVVNRRLLLLGATLTAVIIAVIVTRSGSDTPTAPVARPRPATANRNTPSVENAPPADVKLAALQRERSEPADSGRNPFRFRPKPAPPPPSSALPARTVKPPDMQLDPSVSTAIPTGPPPPPPITLKFIGVLQKADGTRFAVLTDGKRPISGKEGDEVEGRYKILKIGEESIDIAYIDGRGRRTIALTGK